ncbi:putative transposase [Azospirillum canadense]|nr:putative transposase [Azospirillum canadense]
MLGAFCDLYNAGLQQRIEAYRRQGRTLRYVDQAAELKAVRAGDERLSSYSYSAEQQVLRRLDKAFAAFFRRRKTNAKAGFPRFRAKSMFDSAEFRVGDGLTLRKSKRLGIVGIPGDIKVTWHRDLPAGATVGAAVLSRSAGKWFACFQVTLPDAAIPHKDGASVGIDVGLSSLIATLDGEAVETPQWTKRAARKQRRLQRALARGKRSSKRRATVRRNLARHSAATANRRRDFLHKLSRSLVDRYAVIALEDLSVERLARSMLAKAVHNAAWGADSSGRRNSLLVLSLIDGLEQFVQRLGRSFPAEGFARSCVQGEGNGRQGIGVMHGEVGPLGEVLA